MKNILLIIAAFLLMTGTVISQTQEESEMKINVGCKKSVSGTAYEVKFVEVLEDSRCPEGANCIWAGNAKIKIEIKSGENAAESHVLETNGSATFLDIGNYRITLKSLDPYPNTNVQVDSSAYKATFSVKDTR